MSTSARSGGWLRALRGLFSKSGDERAAAVEWLSELLDAGDTFLPRNREDLVRLLTEVRRRRRLFDSDAQAMLEGVLQISELTVKDVMIPNAEVVKFDMGDALRKVVDVVVEEGHSRYPVFAGDRVEGVLLAKELLRHRTDSASPKIGKDMLREPVFEPMSKRLDALLRKFRDGKDHMVIVVDEYGAHAGLVTIEDVLERIVGRITDEYDQDEENITEVRSGKRWRVNGLTPLEELNRRLGIALKAEGIDTVGGWVAAHFGAVPGEKKVLEMGQLRFSVQKSDGKRVVTVEVERMADSKDKQPDLAAN